MNTLEEQIDAVRGIITTEGKMKFSDAKKGIRTIMQGLSEVEKSASSLKSGNAAAKKAYKKITSHIGSIMDEVGELESTLEESGHL